MRKVRAVFPFVAMKPSNDELPLKRLEIDHVLPGDHRLSRKQ